MAERRVPIDRDDLDAQPVADGRFGGGRSQDVREHSRAHLRTRDGAAIQRPGPTGEVAGHGQGWRSTRLHQPARATTETDDEEWPLDDRFHEGVMGDMVAAP